MLTLECTTIVYHKINVYVNVMVEEEKPAVIDFLPAYCYNCDHATSHSSVCRVSLAQCLRGRGKRHHTSYSHPVEDEQLVYVGTSALPSSLISSLAGPPFAHFHSSQENKERFFPLMQNDAPSSKLSLWRNRDYLLLWSSQTISSLGTTISQVTFPLLVLALTNSPLQAGLAGALRLLPYFLCGLPAGALVDRWDRKRVMLICDMGRALSLVSIPLALALRHLTLLQLDLNALIEGTLYVFFDLAEAASLPRVVSSDQLPRVTAQNALTGGITSLIGPALGTALYSLRSLLPFAVDALSYLCSVLSLACIKTHFQQERQIVQRGSLLGEIRVGLVWLWHQPFLRLLALFTGLINLVFPDTSALVVLVL